MRLFLLILLIVSLNILMGEESSDNDFDPQQLSLLEADQMDKSEILQDYLENRFYLTEQYKYSIRNRINFHSELFTDRLFYSQKSEGLSFNTRIDMVQGEKITSNHLLYSLQYQDKNKDLKRVVIEKLILGDFRLNYGKGIVYSSNSQFNSPSFSMNRNTTSDLLTANQSSLSLFRMRGIALQSKWNEIRLISFFSHQTMNAVIDSSGLINRFVTPQNKDLENDNVTENNFGLITEYQKKYIRMSLLVSKQSFSRDFSDSLKNQDIIWVSPALQIRFKELILNSEWAFSNGNPSFNASLHWKIDRFLNKLEYRHYHQNVPEYYGNPFSRSASFADEQGIFYLTDFQMNSEIRLRFSIDHFSSMHPNLNKKNKNGLELTGRVTLQRKKESDLTYRSYQAEQYTSEAWNRTVNHTFLLKQDIITMRDILISLNVIYGLQKTDIDSGYDEGKALIQNMNFNIMKIKACLSAGFYDYPKSLSLSRSSEVSSGMTLSLQGEGFLFCTDLELWKSSKYHLWYNFQNRDFIGSDTIHKIALDVVF